MKRTLSLCIAITALNSACYVDATVTAPVPPSAKKASNNEKEIVKPAERNLADLDQPSPDLDQVVDVAILKVAGLQSSKGSICYSVFDSSQGFPDDPENTVAAQCEPIPTCIEKCADFSVEFEIVDLEFGTDYAIALFQDIDGDGKMETRGPLKIPAEAFGFSNNPDIFATLGAPTYESCVVSWSEKSPRVTINLQRLL